MSETVFVLLDSILTSALVLITFLVISKWRYSVKKIILITLAHFIACTALLFVGFFIFSENLRVSLTHPATIVIVLISFCLCVNQYLGFRGIFTIATACSFSNVIYIIGALTLSILNNMTIFFIVTVAATLLINFLNYKYLRIQFIKMYKFNQQKWWVFACITIICNNLIFFIVGYPNRVAKTDIPIIVIYAITTFLVFLSTNYVFSKTYDSFIKERNISLVENSIKAISTRIEIADQSNKQFALLRHDARHYYNIISELISQNNNIAALDALKNFNQLIDKSETTNPKIYCKNKFINAVINYHTQTAKENEISFTILAEANENLLFGLELAALIGNCLENAISACKKVEQNKSKEIVLQMHHIDSQIFIEITNSVNGKIELDSETGLPLTSKQGHGLGTLSVQYFAQKYNASFSYKQQGDSLMFRLLV